MDNFEWCRDFPVPPEELHELMLDFARLLCTQPLEFDTVSYFVNDLSAAQWAVINLNRKSDVNLGRGKLLLGFGNRDSGVGDRS